LPVTSEREREKLPSLRSRSVTKGRGSLGEVADDLELAAAVLEPHFDAVRDVFAEYRPNGGNPLKKLCKVQLIVDEAVRDSPRHYAACRTDGKYIILAPQAAELPLETLVAIITHEFGHAADFMYPGMWVSPDRGDEEAIWIGDREPDKYTRKWFKLWNQRSDDQVEMAADSIAYTVTGMPITYCGPCMLQCFSGQKARPRGLR